jgi:uncharacterized RDD family membrane protein YckC
MSSAFIAGAAESSNVKFLPRFGALLLDFIVVIVAAQLLATAAHHLSRGSVQGALGLAFVNCWPVKDMPALYPPPPPEYNFAFRCDRSLLGLDMANWIAVGKVTSLGNGHFDKDSQQFALGPGDEQAFAPMIVGDGVIVFSVFPYLAIADWLFGATAGKWILGLRTVDAGNPRRRGLPFRKAVIRNVVMHAGILVSTVIVFVYQLASEDIEGSVSVARFLYLSVLGWILWNSGRLLLGSETLYDLAAGTTVVRK